MERIEGVLNLTRADDAGLLPQTPVLLDSPHSGTAYPEDFGTAVDLDLLQCMEDAFVDRLFGAGPEKGASLLAAEFPRSYIDPNRASDDLDWRLMNSAWPGNLKPTEKTRLGHGLIWRTCPGEKPMYERLLTVSEVQARIENYWKPYHEALEGELARLFSLFGGVWHVNCHSMPAASSPFVAGAVGGRRADIVLGDRDGRSCHPAFTAFVREWFEARGYKVRVNNPYKGAELVRVCGQPEFNRHSLQVEINRAIYMDEQKLVPTRNFGALQRDLTQLISDICGFALSECHQAAAE
ncbi:N-formylglutamate amidohydrolase [Aestuariispira ectoiniformans]|uniref:N-formylglutamate amidohydrolase n=1 Tax=Aestuariispira ectoiniformans TaxID=2775080 RepID=UPI00223AE888|nr:N-formylglutamate amidohydrolase [Aestuariispira ectoiniformans]